MDVQIFVKEWKYKEVEDVRKIVGTYALKAGKTELADQQFNDGYGATTIIFPTELMVEVENLTKRIESAIIKNLTGKEE